MWGIWRTCTESTQTQGEQSKARWETHRGYHFPLRSSSDADSSPAPAAPPRWCGAAPGAWVGQEAAGTAWRACGWVSSAAGRQEGPRQVPAPDPSSPMEAAGPAPPRCCWCGTRWATSAWSQGELSLMVGGWRRLIKLTSAGAAVALLCRQGELKSQCLPPETCTQACWRQTPWHTGARLQEETSLDQNRNLNIWEQTGQRKTHRVNKKY